jgi:hypothetical protein
LSLSFSSSRSLHARPSLSLSACTLNPLFLTQLAIFPLSFSFSFHTRTLSHDHLARPPIFASSPCVFLRQSILSKFAFIFSSSPSEFARSRNYCAPFTCVLFIGLASNSIISCSVRVHSQLPAHTFLVTLSQEKDHRDLHFTRNFHAHPAILHPFTLSLVQYLVTLFLPPRALCLETSLRATPILLARPVAALRISNLAAPPRPLFWLSTWRLG